MKRVAAPMVGGMITATLLTLVVIPAIYLVLRRWQVARHPRPRCRTHCSTTWRSRRKTSVGRTHDHSPALGAVLMSLSTVIVAVNARLLGQSSLRTEAA